MLSQKTLVDIVKDEIENDVRNGNTFEDFYYILLDGSMCQANDYDDVVAAGEDSSNNIYAYVVELYYRSLDSFLFDIDYLDVLSVNNIVDAYLRKMGFTIVNEHDELPSPNLKYFIHAVVELNNYTPEYLGIVIYDIDSIARILHIPQIVEQKLGSQPREITTRDVDDIYELVTKKQPILAGYTYKDAYRILLDCLVFHEKKYKKEAAKIALAFAERFPMSYIACYKWNEKAKRFVDTNCLTITFHSSSS